jgi:hypothetical protein
LGKVKENRISWKQLNDMRYIIALFFLFTAFGCSMGCRVFQSNEKTVNITLANASTNELVGVQIVWHGPYVPGGILSPGISKTTVSAKWPNLPNAKIDFIDRHTRKPYSIEVSFASVNDRILSGKCHQVTIRILDYDKADVNCE